jgi:hypothetical protein
MIKNKQQVKDSWYESERARRRLAEEGSVQALTLPEIDALLEIPYDRSELRAERKRRLERLRYARLMANPATRAAYREHKRNYRQSVKSW